MNIIVCIKPVTKSNENTKRVINDNDRYAIEEALKIKDKNKSKIITLAMGPISSRKVLERTMRLGIDQSILLSDNIYSGSDTNATSYILSKAINKIKDYALIICGNVSSDSATGQIGPSLAAKLDIPFVSNVIKIEKITDKEIICESITDTGIIKISLILPALISVAKNINIPRLATVDGIINSKQVEIWDNSHLDCDVGKCGVKGSPTKVIKLTNLKKQNKECIYIKGTPKEQVKELLKIIKEDLICNINKTDTFQINKDKIDNEIFVYCEAYNDNVKDISLQILSKARDLSINSKVSAVIFSKDNKILNSLSIHGADKIYAFDEDNNYYNQVINIINLINEKNPTIVLFGKTFYGKLISAFIASKLKTGLTADCINLSINKDKILIQQRIVYEGTKLANIICENKRPQMATITKDLFLKRINIDNKAEIIFLRDKKYNDKIKILDMENSEYSVSNNNIIIVGGAGLKTKENFDKLKLIAKRINCNYGGTRKTVDLNFIESKYQIGQTGKSTSSNTYIGFGVSGASEHILGLKCERIIAINNDPKAPIFKKADYGIIGDVNLIIPIILKELEEKEWISIKKQKE